MARRRRRPHPPCGHPAARRGPEGGEDSGGDPRRGRRRSRLLAPGTAAGADLSGIGEEMREICFERDGTRLFTFEDGEGRPIVMLHGGMASHVASLPLVAPLASRYRVLMPDVRGN